MMLSFVDPQQKITKHENTHDKQIQSQKGEKSKHVVDAGYARPTFQVHVSRMGLSWFIKGLELCSYLMVDIFQRL